MHFGILGAGVIGLNTALELQREFPTARVTIIADKFQEETCSYGAAGIFRPGTSFMGPSEEVTRKWIVDSYNFYEDIFRSEESARAGVLQVSGYTLSENYESVTRNPFLEGLLPAFRPATPEELRLCPGNWKYGSYSTTFVIDQSYFLSWAMKRFEAAGGRLRRQKVDKLTDLATESFDAVFNCTGLASNWLCNDLKVVPVRGQVYKVRAPWIKMFFYNDFDTYVIPGTELVTLGGTRQLDSWNESVDPNDAKGIWDRCTRLVPSIQRAEVVKQWVGLRPHRSQVRCEVEEMNAGGNRRLKVVHQYGHGGYGVTTGPGSAKYAVQIMRDSLRQSGAGSYLSKL